ncbi:MAG: hypothetical protein AB3N10_02355 [Allomuricauda sp.]
MTLTNQLGKISKPFSKELAFMNKTYKILLGNQEIGISRFEKADASMGVVFGLIEFNEIESPYRFFKNYCAKNGVDINTDDPEFEFIDTHVIPELKVLRPDGIEIKGVAGNAICGMREEGYEISILGINYPFYAEEFPHHVKAYKEMLK